MRAQLPPDLCVPKERRRIKKTKLMVVPHVLAENVLQPAALLIADKAQDVANLIAARVEVGQDHHEGQCYPWAASPSVHASSHHIVDDAGRVRGRRKLNRL